MNQPIDDTTNDRDPDTVIDVSDADDRELAGIVLAAIAEELGVDPISLPPLGNTINPDLINDVVDENYPAVRSLSFEYLGYEVTISQDGEVRLQLRN